MVFYTAKDLEQMLGYSKSKAYNEIKECNTILKTKYGVQRTYPGRIKKDLYEELTGKIKTTVNDYSRNNSNNCQPILG
jgi:hypothetical protein